MKFLFTKLTTDHQEDYLKEKIRKHFAVFQEDHNERSMAQFADEQLPFLIEQHGKEVPVATEKAFYEISERQEAIIEASKRCALDSISRNSPLVSGEEIISDFFSFLLEDFEGIHKNTGVLVRVTNKAEIVYFFDNVFIEDGEVIHIDIPSPKMPEEIMLRAASSSFITKLLKSALSSAASSVGSKLGTMILNLVLKEVFGIEGDNEKLIKEIRNVVKEEVQANEIDKITAKINGLVGFMTVEYFNLRNASDLSKVEDRRELSNKIYGFIPSFKSEVIELLMLPSFASKTLVTFQTAATLHLLVIQEQALVDPKFLDPNKSSYKTTFLTKVNDYYSHIDDIYNKIIDNRIDQMKVFQDSFVDCMGNQCVHKNGYKWSDEATGFVSGRYYDTKNGDSAATKASRAMEAHKNKVITQLRKDLGNPEINVLPYLKQLKTFRFPKM